MLPGEAAASGSCQAPAEFSLEAPAGWPGVGFVGSLCGISTKADAGVGVGGQWSLPGLARWK